MRHWPAFARLRWRRLATYRFAVVRPSRLHVRRRLVEKIDGFRETTEHAVRLEALIDRNAEWVESFAEAIRSCGNCNVRWEDNG